MSKSVALLAMGPSLIGYLAMTSANNRNARVTDKVWALNAAAYWINDIDRAFSMDDLQRDKENWPGYVEGLQRPGIPLYSSRAYPEIKGSVEYPLEEVHTALALPPPWDKQWMDNTANYMLALAITEEYDSIILAGYDYGRDLYGLNPRYLREMFCDLKGNEPAWMALYREKSMKGDGEPGAHSSAFLCGIAVSRGIKVTVIPGTRLMNYDRAGFLYGYQEVPDWAWPGMWPLEDVPERPPE